MNSLDLRSIEVSAEEHLAVSLMGPWKAELPKEFFSYSSSALECRGMRNRDFLVPLWYNYEPKRFPQIVTSPPLMESQNILI